jgi:hypothetical protein
MNHVRSSSQMPCRLVWKRPAEAAQWDAAWCSVPLAGSDTGAAEVAPRRQPVRAAPVPVDGTPLGEHATPHALGLTRQTGAEVEARRALPRSPVVGSRVGLDQAGHPRVRTPGDL